MKEKLSLLFKIIIVIVSGIGLFLNFRLLSIRESIIYFTMQSNLLCFILFLGIVILMITKKLKKNDLYYMLKGTATMAITVTMIVYQLLLSGNGGMGAYIGHELECNFVHLYVPLLVIFDYIIFGEKGHLKKSYPFIWSSALIAYLLFDIIYVSLGGRFVGGTTYPYFFMDIEGNGVIFTMLSCLVIYIFFIGYGSIVQWLDNKLAK